MHDHKNDRPSKVDRVKEHWNDTETLYNDFDSFNQTSNTSVQAKLEIGEPNDKFEQEADSIADGVVNTPDLQTKPIGQNNTPTIMAKGEAGGIKASPKVESQINSSKGQGAALPKDTQKEMGGKIGSDFSDVKVHTDSNAIQMNKDLNAKAFTHGKDVYFNEGNYNPGSKNGKHLLAHELTHTVQQGEGNSSIQRSIEDEVDEKTKQKVDDTAATIKKELGFNSFKPEEAIEAYRMVQKLSQEGIEYFYFKYSEMAYYIDWYLPGEFRKSQGFGFQKGISKEEQDKLIAFLKDDETWKDANPDPAIDDYSLLDLTMSMVIDAFVIVVDNDDFAETMVDLNPEVKQIIKDKAPNSKQQEVLKTYGFEGIEYMPQKYMPEELTKVKGMGGMGVKYLFTERDKRKGVISSMDIGFLGISKIFSIWQDEKRPELVGFSLAEFEGAMGGSTMGVDFEQEIDPDTGKPIKGSTQGKLDFKADFEDGTANISAVHLPFTGINYQGDDYAFKCGKGTFDDVNLDLKWDPNTEDDDMVLEADDKNIDLFMGLMEFNNLRMTEDESTYAIGSIKITNLEVQVTQHMGPSSALSNTYDLMMRMSTNMLDISSLVTYGLIQVMYRFTTPSNQEEADSRKDGREGLADLMKTQFYEEFGISIGFDNLEINNFIYIDKDTVKNDEGDYLSKKSPDIEFIKGIKTGRTDIDISTIGVPNENKGEIFQLKKQLLEVNSELSDAQEDYQKFFLKGRKKRTAKIAEEITELEAKIDSLKKRIQLLQPDMAFELKAEVEGFSITKGDMLDEIVEGTLDDYAETTTGIGDTTARSFVFETKFNQSGIFETSVKVKDLNIPELTLTGVHYTAEDGSLDLAAEKAVFTNINAELDVNFKDQTNDPALNEIHQLQMDLSAAYHELDFLTQPSLANKGYTDPVPILAKIGRLVNEILAKREAYDPGAPEFVAQQEINDLKHQLAMINADIVALNNPPSPKYFEPQALRAKEQEKAEMESLIAVKEEEAGVYSNPVESVYIKSLTIDKAEAHELYLALPNKRLVADFDNTAPVILQGLFVKNLLINPSADKMFTAGDGSDRISTGLTRLIVPEGLLIDKDKLSEDEQIVDDFNLNMNAIVAEGITLDIIKENGIEYEMKSLSGSGTFDNMQVNEDDPDDMSDRLTFIQLPGSNDPQSFVKGSYKDGVLKNVIYIPEIHINALNLHDENSHFVIPGGSLPTMLTGISIDTEIKFNKDENAENSIEEFTITSFTINELSSAGLTIDYNDMHVDIPAKEFSVIKGLYVTNLRMTSSVVEEEDKEGNKTVKVVWDKEAVMKDGKAVNTKAGLQSSNLPLGFNLKVGEKLGAEMTDMSSGKIDFEFLETGGIAYSAKNLDAAGRFWQKNDEGEITTDVTGEIDSKSIVGFYKEDTIGSGKDAQKRIVTKNVVDIPKIHVSDLNFIGENIKINTTDMSDGATIENITADIKVTILKPSANQLEQATKDKQEIKDDITVFIKELDMEKISVKGLHVWQQKVEVNAGGTETVTKASDITIPYHMPATLNMLHMSGFTIHQPHIGKVTHDGYATLGNEGVKGLDMGGIMYQGDNFLKRTVMDVYGFPMKADKIAYTADKNGSIVIEIENPDVDANSTSHAGYREKNEDGTTKDYFGIGKDYLNNAKDIFDADNITVMINPEGQVLVQITNPTLKNLQVTHDGSHYSVNGKINGLLTIETGMFEFGDTSNGLPVLEDGLHIYTDEDILLTDLDVLKGKSRKPSKRSIIIEDRQFIGDMTLPQPVYKNFEKPEEETQFDALDTANGTVDLKLAGISARTINVKEGRIEILETRSALAKLLHDVIDSKHFEWGGWAMLFFDWVQDYTWIPYLGERGWKNDLFWGLDQGFEDDDREDAKEFFADWVRGQVNRLKLIQRSDGVYLAVGDVITGGKSIKIAESGLETEVIPDVGDVLDDAWEDIKDLKNPIDKAGENIKEMLEEPWQTMMLSDVLEYNTNYSPIPEGLDSNLPSSWNINDYPTMEDMFRELYTNEYYWLDYGLRPPDGDKVAPFISTWVGEKLGPWFISNLEFDINLDNIDLEKIAINDPNQEFKYDDLQPDGIGASVVGSADNFEAEIDDIPAFTYTKVNEAGKKMILHTGGILTEKFLFEKLSGSPHNSELTNDSIIIKGLDVKIEK
jgi:hypothetical protein